MEIKTLIMAILITVVALFALTALFIWLGSKLEDNFAKQRDKARKLDQPKPDIHEEIQNTFSASHHFIHHSSGRWKVLRSGHGKSRMSVMRIVGSSDRLRRKAESIAASGC